MPGIETACVKRALSRTAGAIIPPVRAHGIIRDAAERAVRPRERIAPPEYAPLYHFEIELRQPLSDEARTAFGERFPEFTIEGDRTVTFSDRDMHVCYRRAAITSYIAAEPASVRTY